MAPLKVEQYVVGPVQTNCYFAVNDETKEMILIDPGANADRLIQIIEEEKLNPVAILLTHGHFDHAGGAAEVAAHFGIKVYAEEHERETLDDPKLNLSGWTGAETTYRADVFLKDEQEFDLAGFHIRVLFTPGHTVGGCCYYFAYQDALFSGDTLFAGSVGRTDFPGGDAKALLHSIRVKYADIGDYVKVCPGHGPTTTMEIERAENPYM